MRRTNVISKPTRTKIAKTFDAALMSDTKRRKLFVALDRPDIVLQQAIAKFIDSDTELTIAVPKRHSLYPPRAYIDVRGPVALRCIEWIEFPAVAEYPRTAPNGTGRVPPTRVVQDLAKVQRILAQLGRFPIEQTKRGIRIAGYSRQTDSK
jgi:hypothetical protein